MTLRLIYLIIRQIMSLSWYITIHCEDNDVLMLILQKCYLRQYELVDRYERSISKMTMDLFFPFTLIFVLSSIIDNTFIDLTTWETWRYLIRSRNCLSFACNWLYIRYFGEGLFCPSFNFSLLYCFALFVIVLCLVFNEGPVWLNELGSWIT